MVIFAGLTAMPLGNAANIGKTMAFVICRQAQSSPQLECLNMTMSFSFPNRVSGHEKSQIIIDDDLGFKKNSINAV